VGIEPYQLALCQRRAHGPTDELRELPGGKCIWVPRGTSSAPFYGRGTFFSQNPKAIAWRQERDASGRITLSYSSADGTIQGSECISNCGKGTGVFGFGGGAAEIVKAIAQVGSQVVLATQLPYYAVGATLSSQVERGQKGMGLDIGALIGGIGGAATQLGGFSGNPYLQIGGTLASAFGQAAARPAVIQQPIAASYGPVYNPLPPYQPQGPVVRTQAPAVVGGAVTVLSASRALILGILAKVAAALGKRGITLSSAIALAKKLGQFFVSREAIAVYLGITVDELAQLFIAHHVKKHRRMNPANARALRRSMRRLRSFDRLAARVSARIGRGGSRGRRRAARALCRTCRRDPCAC